MRDVAAQAFRPLPVKSSGGITRPPNSDQPEGDERGDGVSLDRRGAARDRDRECRRLVRRGPRARRVHRSAHDFRGFISAKLNAARVNMRLGRSAT